MVGDEKPSLEELAHYGIKGMKWNVRRGGLLSRYRGAIADNAQQREKILTRRVENRSKGVEERLASNVDRLLGGRKRMVRRGKKEIARLRQRQARIKRGEMTARDILSGLNNVSVLDLFVSRRDNRG